MLNSLELAFSIIPDRFDFPKTFRLEVRFPTYTKVICVRKNAAEAMILAHVLREEMLAACEAITERM